MTMINVIIEPVCENSALYLQSISGIQQGAAQQRKKVRLFQNVQGLMAASDTNIALIVSANLDWTQHAAGVLRKAGHKMILVGPAFEVLGEDFSGPTLNRKDLVRKLLQYFISAGRTRIACVGSSTPDINDQIRNQAFLTIGKSLGLSVSIHDVYDSDEGLDLCVEHFLDEASRYNGAICVNDLVAVELLAQAKQRGIKVPDQLFVAGSGDFRMGLAVTPSLTTTTLDYYQMGVLATEIWQLMHKYKDAVRIKISLPCELIIRKSTACFEPVISLNTAKGAQLAKHAAHDDNTANFLRKFENCLMSCDPLDIKIISGILANESIAAMAERLFVSMGTINYRLKQLYLITGISQKTDLMQQLRKYISSETMIDYMGFKVKYNNKK